MRLAKVQWGKFRLELPAELALYLLLSSFLLSTTVVSAHL
jgi:hypothetical protein